MYHADMPEHLERLLWEHVVTGPYTPNVLAEVVDAYNRSLMEICEQHEVDRLDLASQVPRDTSAFYDDCHFNASGCEQVANLLATYFVSRMRQAADRLA
jgi:hypothetical protein|tara:strand:+ start:53 stop:349 length:297 start_codon:yes stop_codon:yes gene_type:complete